MEGSKKSWRTKKTAETSNSLTVTVYSKDRYQIAHLLEHGHAKRGGGRVAEKEHIAPAEKNGDMFRLMMETSENAIDFVRGKMRLLNPNKFTF